MDKDQIQENSFEAAPGGKSGILNYQTGYGTPQGGDYIQDPAHFASSDKTVSHFVPDTSKGSSPVNKPLPKRPDVQKDTMTPPSQPDPNNKPLDPDQDVDRQVDQLFQKKNTPSPDEILSGLQYELSQMIKKDKHVAKRIVLKNLRQDPQYYSRLNMLNIDDKKMKVDETTVSKTKAVLDEMIANRQKNRPVATSPELNKIFRDLSDRRMACRAERG